MFVKLSFKIHNDVLLILDENLSIKIYPSHLEQVFKKNKIIGDFFLRVTKKKRRS